MLLSDDVHGELIDLAYFLKRMDFLMQGLSELTGLTALDKRLTLVLMTHNRPAFLRRALEFYSAFPYTILVVDTSGLPSSEIVRHFPQIEYRHLPDFNDRDYQTKLAFAAQQVKTPYMVLVDDDDFIVRDAMGQCLDFLDQNPDYGFCHGYSLMYLATGSEVKYYYRDRKGMECFASDDAGSRLLDFAGHYISPFYAVTRTELLTRWYDVAPALSAEYLQVGLAAFLLLNAKARILPVAYSVRELNYPEPEHEALIQKALTDAGQAEQSARVSFAQSFAELPSGLQGLEKSGRIDVLLKALEEMGRCLSAQTSLTTQEIFSANCGWRDGPQHSFLPTQYVEMPFYNQSFFSVLEQIEFLLFALPCGVIQVHALEPILLKQQEVVRDRGTRSVVENHQYLEEGFDLYPFGVELGRRLLSSLRQQGDSQRAQQLAAWIQRLEQVQRTGTPTVLEDSLSGMLYQRLHAWQPTQAQQDAVAETLRAHQGGPLFGLVLLDLKGDINKLQTTLDSILEGYYKRYQIVVLTTGAPPVKTQESDRLHFVQVHQVDWQHQFNRVVERSAWDWVLSAELGVCFSPSALMKVALELLSADACRAVYCDELQRLPSGKLTSLYRPSFNLDLLLSSPRNMAGHWLIRREVFLELGGYSARYPQACALDFILRLIEAGGMSGVGHIDELLLISDYDTAESNLDELNALRRHLNARGYERGAVLQTRPRAYHLRYGHTERPLVSILIPTRDQFALVTRCVESILERTRYKNFEIILIDNLSEADDAVQWLNGIEAMADEKLRVLRYPHPFNFSAMNNCAAAQARGDYLVLMNNDTAVIDDNWLDELLNHAQRPEVGIVGARLHYPDGTLQHAGVLLGLRGPAEHPWLRRDPQAPSYMNRSQLDQNFSAVTAACLMIRKSVYEQVEGLDEQAFAVSYNDVDLCLKVGEAGYLNVWAPRAVVMHEGSVSQETVDPLSSSAKRMRFVNEQNAFYERWMPKLVNDPAYNRNLSLSGNGFELDNKPLLDPALRVQPEVLVVAGPTQKAKLLESWSGLSQQASVTVVAQRLRIADLLRTAPDVLVMPGGLSYMDPLSLQHFHQYFDALKVLDLCAFETLAWERVEQVPEHILKALPLVDRVLVPSDDVALALRGLHADIRIVPPLLEVASAVSVSSGAHEQVDEAALAACLP